MRLMIIGAGGHGQVIQDVARHMDKYVSSTGNVQIFFLDDKFEEKSVNTYGTITYDVISPCSAYKEYINDETEFYPAFGNNFLRLEWMKWISEAGGKLATIIHPSAYVADSVKLDKGTVILPHAVVNSGCRIGRGCIINVGAIIDHGCVIEDGCHINSGAIVMAENRISCRTKVDSGQIVSFRQYPI